jgi:hypothetical protein
LGYDITFHPIGREEQRFVFEVLDDPGLLKERLELVIPRQEERAPLSQLFA